MHYHNDNEKSCVRWLHHLMNQGFIQEGYIDDRSITEIKPEEIKDFTQCHFFAGIGGWSQALRLAGWNYDRPIWTASCPCQPFSVAGARKGEDDKRHLWPDLFELIKECRPSVVVGEQVASNLGRDWLASVFDDLETLEYRVAGADLCAAGVGAPHIRQRLYWVAYSERRATERHGFQMAGEEGRSQEEIRQGSQRVWHDAGDGSNPVRLANTDNNNGRANKARGLGRSQEKESPDNTGIRSIDDRIGNPISEGLEGHAWNEQRGCESGREQTDPNGSNNATGGWGNVRWIRCSDGKARPIESRVLPLAHGVPGRMDAIKGYGNAIVPQVAATFIKAIMEIIK